MRSYRLAARLGIIGAVLAMLLVPLSAFAMPESFTWGSFSSDGSTGYGVYQAGNSAVLQTGAQVQLIYAGPDGKIDLPFCDGRPGGDDELLQVSVVQNQGSFPRPLHSKGYVPFATLTFDSSDPRAGGVVYIRAWDKAERGRIGLLPAGWAPVWFENPLQPAMTWGDSATGTLSSGVVFNAPRWSTNKRCNPAYAGATPVTWPGAGTAFPGNSFQTAGARSAGNMAPRRQGAAAATWYLLAWPLLPADTTLDGILGTQLHGTADPLTADRVFVWNAEGQSYSSAWFCSGPTCESWGPNYYNHWLDTSYALSSLTLPPDEGFWIQNRSGVAESLSIAGDVASAPRSVSVGVNWQLLGSAIPVARELDQANLPATGSDSPITADRVFYWDSATNSYEVAWFCGGPVCQSWGAQYYNHWLDTSYAPTTIVLEPGHGFWYQNRHQPFTWTNPLP